MEPYYLTQKRPSGKAAIGKNDDFSEILCKNPPVESFGCIRKISHLSFLLEKTYEKITHLSHCV
jgi:hypothetical protein